MFLSLAGSSFTTTFTRICVATFGFTSVEKDIQDGREPDVKATVLFVVSKEKSYSVSPIITEPMSLLLAVVCSKYLEYISVLDVFEI